MDGCLRKVGIHCDVCQTIFALYANNRWPASVTGVITELPQEGLNGIHNGVKIKTRSLVLDNDQDILIGKHGLQSGNVIIENKTGIKYYLRDDYAFRQATQMENPPRSVPVLKNTFIDNDRGVLRGKIYDDYFTNHRDGELVEIKTNWREPPINISILGGHMINSLDGKSFYVQRDTLLWPPMLSAKESLDIRQRLPHVGNGKTILDVLQAEMSRLGDYALDTIGPCLAMPRLLYGSHEDEFTTHMDPDGFDDSNFVTLRYRWHAVKEAEINKYQKAIIDVSRVAESLLRGEAESIHVPLNPYYCRSLSSGGPPRYATSFFRVVSVFVQWHFFVVDYCTLISCVFTDRTIIWTAFRRIHIGMMRGLVRENA